MGEIDKNLYKETHVRLSSIFPLNCFGQIDQTARLSIQKSNLVMIPPKSSDERNKKRPLLTTLFNCVVKLVLQKYGN